MTKSLIELYQQYNYLSAKDLIEICTHYGYSEEEAKRFVYSIPRYSLASRRVRPKKLRYTTLKVPGTFMIDYVFFQGNVNPFLFIINVVSRKVWVYPLKDKSLFSFANAFVHWLHQDKILYVADNGIAEGDESYRRFVASIICDREGAFTSNEFQSYCNGKRIKLHFKDVDEHNILGVLDRAVRTIKDTLYYRASTDDVSLHVKTQEDFNNLIKRIVQDYNNTPHSGIKGYTPNEVYDDMDLQLKFLRESRRYNKNIRAKNRDSELKVGDKVRVLDRKTSNIQKSKRFSDEVYTIRKKNPYSYEIDAADELGNISTKRFKDYELLNVKDQNPSYAKQNEKYFRELGRQIQEYNRDPDYVAEDMNDVSPEVPPPPPPEIVPYEPVSYTVPINPVQQEIQDRKENRNMLNVVQKAYTTRSGRVSRPPKRFLGDEYYATGKLW